MYLYAVLSVLNKKGLNDWVTRHSVEAMLKKLLADPVVFDRMVKDTAFAKQVANEAIEAPNLVRDGASAVGTDAHEVIDRFALMTAGERVECLAAQTDLANVSVLKAFLAWEKECAVRVVFKDTFVYSHVHKFAGAIVSSIFRAFVSFRFVQRDRRTQLE